jgi:hypothetical protein
LHVCWDGDQQPGVGSIYLGSYKDKDGDWLDGAKTCRFRVPPNAPVAQLWSLTVYAVDTRSLIQNEQQLADRSSRQDLVKNADGSIDLNVRPTQPKGFEKNWVPSLPDQAWFAYFPLYGPTEAHFDGKWYYGFAESGNERKPQVQSGAV